MKAHLQSYEYGDFRVWDPPKIGTEYVIGADTAEGKQRDIGSARRHHLGSRSDRPDYSTAIVLELETSVHVATYKGHIDSTDWGYTLAAIGFYYNEGLIVPEVNGPGVEVINTLTKRVSYPDIYMNRLFGRIQGDDLGPSWGWRTSGQTRPILIARIEELLSHYILFTRDHELISELRTMEIDEKGTPRARHPNHDDLVIALGLALQGRHERLHNIGRDKPVDLGLEKLDPHSRKYWTQRREHQKRVHERIRNPARAGLLGPGLRDCGPGPR